MGQILMANKTDLTVSTKLRATCTAGRDRVKPWLLIKTTPKTDWLGHVTFEKNLQLPAVVDDLSSHTKTTTTLSYTTIIIMKNTSATKKKT